MNIFQRFLARQLSKWVSASPRGNGSRIWIPSRGKTAGESVTHDTAMTYSAVWRAVCLISESIAALPWGVRERSINASGRTITKPLLNHPAASLLDLQPNPETDAFQFRQTLISHALSWGNGYAEIVRDKSNRPAELWQIEPDRVRLDRTEAGALVYDISNGQGPNTVIQAADMFHLKGPSFDGLIGYSVISYAARSIGVGMATEQFGADFFANGAHPSMVLQHPGKLGDEAIGHLKDSVSQALSGRNKLKPFVLEEGMSAQQWTIPPEDAQFLETRKFNVAEIARWFGVPLHKLHEMDKSTFNNIEQQNIEFVTGSLLSWIKRLELEANIKLISPAMRTRIYSKINMNGMMRGDTQARGEWYKAMSTMGVFSVNDILELEDRNPIGPEGDKRLVQINLTTLDKIGEEQPAPEPTTPAPAPAEEENPETSEDEPQNAAALAVVGEVVGKAMAREKARINDAIKNKKTQADFLAYVDKFAVDQAQYWKKNLSTPINAFKLNIDIDQFIADQLLSMKMMAVNAFGEQTEYNSGDVDTVTTELFSRATP